MKIHILLGAAVIVLVLLSVEGFPRRGGKHNGHNGHRGRHGAGRRRNYEQVCNQPPQSGLCYARMPMWFYNATSETCETFTYGGCGGNANRFWSEHACNRRCTDPCTKPLDEGEECEDTTKNPKTLYYYDSEEDACKEFEYTGCGGNNNKFRSLNHCERRCVDESSESSETLDTADTDPEGADEEIDGELDEDVEELLDDDDESSDSESRTRRSRRPPCHTARCRLRCPFGQDVLTDENGCVTCRCKPPRCPEVQRCAVFCEHGHEIDPLTGCETCSCKWPEVAVEEDDETSVDETDGTALSLTQSCRNTPRCRMACRNGYQKGPDGCPICRCNPRPTRPSLPEHCQNRPMCRMGCRNGFQTGDDGCPICRCNPPPTRPALPEHCQNRPICRMGCRNGFQTGDDGCPICRCNPPPTSPSLPDRCADRPRCRMACPNGFVTGKDGCPMCRCKPTIPDFPVHCLGRPMCMMYCATGFQTGEDGCPICRCNPPTLEVLAGGVEVAAAAGSDSLTLPRFNPPGRETEEDEEEEEEVTIIRRRRCHVPRCRRRCPYGFQKDEFGCDKCVCNPAPAEPVPEHCQNKPRCYRRCPNGFEVDEEGCPTCRCLPRERNTDLPRPGGGNGGSGPTPCRLLYCFIPCLHGSRPDSRGCPTCDCLPAPSLDSDEELEEQDATLEEAEPRAAALTKCIRLQCFAPCRFGYEPDSNGCQTCNCRPDPDTLQRRRRSHPEAGDDLEEGWRRGRQGPRHCKPVLCPMDFRCPYGFARDAQGCQTCNCRDVVRPLPERSDACSLPMEVGPCFGAIPRFYFNSESGTCESFRFGGCRGNGNNFRSVEDCRRRCEV